MGAQFHRLPQRVDGRVGHLAGIQHQVVPVDAVGLIVAHAGEEDAASLGLLLDVVDGLGGPVDVGSVGGGIGANGQGPGRAENGAAVTADAILIQAAHFAVTVDDLSAEAALAHAHLTADAAGRLPLDDELGG